MRTGAAGQKLTVASDCFEVTHRGKIVDMRASALFLIFCLSTNASLATTVETIIAECSEGHDHPAMSKCVAQRAVEAQTKLLNIEDRVRKALEKSAESPLIVAQRRASYASSVSSYGAYRKDQCKFRGALTAIGVYSGEFERACEAQLDAERAAQLEQGMSWLE